MMLTDKLRDLLLVVRGHLSFDRLEQAQRRAIAANDLALSHMRAYEAELHRYSALMTQLMQIDEQLFRMSQCSSWEQMRPIFAKLMAEAEGRRKHVSNRVGEREIARISSEDAQVRAELGPENMRALEDAARRQR